VGRTETDTDGRLAVRPDSCSGDLHERGRANPALHRLRHGVATHLVEKGKLLKAQARLGHRDPSTTLRHYSHAVPLDNLDVADELDQVLNDR
jgi:integrase